MVLDVDEGKGHGLGPSGRVRHGTARQQRRVVELLGDFTEGGQLFLQGEREDNRSGRNVKIRQYGRYVVGVTNVGAEVGASASLNVHPAHGTSSSSATN